MALLQCSIEDGPRPGYKAIGVASIEGRTEYLAIEERFLVRRGDTYLLPVRLIGRDRRYNTALRPAPCRGGQRRQPRVGQVGASLRNPRPGSRMILCDREVELAMGLGLIVIDPRPDPSFMDSTTIDLRSGRLWTGGSSRPTRPVWVKDPLGSVQATKISSFQTWKRNLRSRWSSPQMATS